MPIIQITFFYKKRKVSTPLRVNGHL